MRSFGVPGMLGMVLASTLLILQPDSCRASLVPFDFDASSPLLLSINGTLTFDVSTGYFNGLTEPLAFSADFLPSGFVLFSGSTQAVIDLFVDPSGGFMNSGPGCA
jgi:hypothetical protein